MKQFVMALVLTSFCTSLHAEPNANVKYEKTGKIAYKLIDSGAWRGDEDFRLTVFQDGSKTIRITNNLGETSFFRDVVLRVEENLRPVDLYISHWQDGAHRGTGYYWLNGGKISALISAPEGLLQQTIDVPEKFSIATRPQATFGWHFWYFDFDKGGSQSANIFVTAEPVGKDVGSITGYMEEFEVKLLGEERIRVPAGTFDTWHLMVGGVYEIWVEKQDLLTVKLLREAKNRVYELVELNAR